MASGQITLLLVLACMGAVLSVPKSTNEKVLVCYFSSWAVYRPGSEKFDVEDIDPFICTHVVYDYAGLDSYSVVMVSLDPYNDLYDNYGKGAYIRFTRLKEKNPKLKTLLAIGGWNEGSTSFSKMVSTPENRKKFLLAAVDFLKEYGFDGLDFDWEYPTFRGGQTEDKKNFAVFIAEARQLFDKNNLIVTAAVSSNTDIIDSAYDVPTLGKYLHSIHLSCDYSISWDLSIEYPQKYGEYVFSHANLSVHHWIEKGAPAEKLVMGVNLFGELFSRNQDSEEYKHVRDNPYRPGNHTLEEYNEICEEIGRDPSAWTTLRDPNIFAPYSYSENKWIGYDDAESLKFKAQFAVDLHLRGLSAWSIEADDFNGECMGIRNPLLSGIRDGLNAGSSRIATGSN